MLVGTFNFLGSGAKSAEREQGEEKQVSTNPSKQIKAGLCRTCLGLS